MEAPAQNLNTVVVDKAVVDKVVVDKAVVDAEGGKNDHFAVDDGNNFPGNLNVFSKLFCLFW